MSALFGEELEEVNMCLETIKTNAEYVGAEVQLPQDVRNALREITKAANQAKRVLARGEKR